MRCPGCLLQRWISEHAHGACDQSSRTGDELAFKQADAAAMGQHLLVKKSHTSTVESDHELANALQEVRQGRGRGGNTGQ